MVTSVCCQRDTEVHKQKHASFAATDTHYDQAGFQYKLHKDTERYDIYRGVNRRNEFRKLIAVSRAPAPTIKKSTHSRCRTRRQCSSTKRRLTTRLAPRKQASGSESGTAAEAKALSAATLRTRSPAWQVRKAIAHDQPQRPRHCSPGLYARREDEETRDFISYARPNLRIARNLRKAPNIRRKTPLGWQEEA